MSNRGLWVGESWSGKKVEGMEEGWKGEAKIDEEEKEKRNKERTTVGAQVISD